MEFGLYMTNKLFFDDLVRCLPAVPVPDIDAAIAVLPSWSQLYSNLTATIFATTGSSQSPLGALAAIGRTAHAAATAPGLTLNTLPSHNILRQLVEIYIILYLAGVAMYVLFAVPSYYYVFDHNHMKHPKFLKNQIRLEIAMGMKAIPGVALLTTPWLFGRVRGWSKIYNHIYLKDAILSEAAAIYSPPASAIQQTFAATLTNGTSLNAASTAAAAAAAAAKAAAAQTAAKAAMFGPLAPLVRPFLDGWGYVFFSVVLMIFFTDFGVYWAHRLMHHRLVYKRFHKQHHKWVVPTPFASHSFHFIDGSLQSIPYHAFGYLVPIQDWVYIAMFAIANFYAVVIHDGEYHIRSPYLSSAAHHATHHLYFNYNFSQYLSVWDYIGGTHREPEEAMYDNTLRLDKAVVNKQAEDFDSFDDFGMPTDATDPTYHFKSRLMTPKVV